MITKRTRLKKRQGRIRKKIEGTQERPRLCVRRSLKHLYVQLIDDTDSKTVVACSTLDKEFLTQPKEGGKKGAAERLGTIFGGRAKKHGITKIAFDRGGYRYHGRVKALADSLRQAGLEF